MRGVRNAQDLARRVADRVVRRPLGVVLHRGEHADRRDPVREALADAPALDPRLVAGVRFRDDDLHQQRERFGEFPVAREKLRAQRDRPEPDGFAFRRRRREEIRGALARGRRDEVEHLERVLALRILRELARNVGRGVLPVALVDGFAGDRHVVLRGGLRLAPLEAIEEPHGGGLNPRSMSS